MGNFIVKAGVFLFLNFHSSIAFTQNTTIDSLKKVLHSQKGDTNKVNTLNALSGNFFYIGDNKNALENAQTALDLSEKVNFINGKGASLLNIGAFHEYKSEQPEARKNYNKAIEYYKAAGNKTGVANGYIAVASSYNQDGDEPNALENIYKALDIFEEAGDKNGVAGTRLMLGSNLSHQNNNPEALKNYFLALEIITKSGDRDNIAITNASIGEVYFKQGNYAEALRRDSMALEYFDKHEGNFNVAGILSDIGRVYETLGDVACLEGSRDKGKVSLTQALEKYFSAIKIYKETNSESFVYGTYISIGDVFLKLHDFSKARNYLEESRLFFEKEIDHANLEKVYRGLAVLDSASENFSQAYKDYKKSIAHHDSLYQEESVKKMQRITMQYQFDKIEAITRSEQAKKDTEAKYFRYLQYFIIGSVLLLALFLYFNNIQKQKAKSKIEKAYSLLKSTQAQLIQSEKMASLGELTAGIAHEIQNPLNFVNNFSELNKELLTEMNEEIEKENYKVIKAIAKDVIENEEKINHHGKRADTIVKGMLRHSQNSSGQKEPTDINAMVAEYLLLSYQGFRAKDKSFSSSLQKDFDQSIKKINTVSQDMGRVLLNLYNNAFYAVIEKKKLQGESYEPIVSVSTKKLNGKIEIRIRDNGNGIPEKVVDKIFQPFFTTKPTGQGTGLGLSLAYDIINGHRGELKVETKEGEGAEFIIQLPITV